jgi:hypothetical protein
VLYFVELDEVSVLLIADDLPVRVLYRLGNNLHRLSHVLRLLFANAFVLLHVLLKARYLGFLLLQQEFLVLNLLVGLGQQLGHVFLFNLLFVEGILVLAASCLALGETRFEGLQVDLQPLVVLL